MPQPSVSPVHDLVIALEDVLQQSQHEVLKKAGKEILLNGHELSVLMYHRVVRNRSEAGKYKLFVTVEKLRNQLRYLKENGYETLTFQDIHLNGSPLNFKKKVILTFDDGYQDNYELLFPLLKEFNFKAVIFFVTGLKSNEWDSWQGWPALNLMNAEQVREMAQYGIEFGAHTRTHLNLIEANDEEKIRDEIIGSKQDLENLLQKKVVSFSYPYGGVNENIKKITAEAGFQFGISTRSGPYNFGEDKFQIRRIEVNSKTTGFSFRRKVSGNYFNKKSLWYHLSSK